MPVHIYRGPNATDFLRKLEKAHDKYGLPIWVTEYAVADFKATSRIPNRYRRAQVNEFMEATVQGMREMPLVERFAWKTRAAGDIKMGPSTLFHTDGSLTSTGKLDASLETGQNSVRPSRNPGGNPRSAVLRTILAVAIGLFPLVNGVLGSP